MSGRGRSSFNKRQKERSRQEKQREKAERKAQRKLEKQGTVSDDQTNSSQDYPPSFEQLPLPDSKQ
jgi:hypothetical protein